MSASTPVGSCSSSNTPLKPEIPQLRQQIVKKLVNGDLAVVGPMSMGALQPYELREHLMTAITQRTLASLVTAMTDGGRRFSWVDEKGVKCWSAYINHTTLAKCMDVVLSKRELGFNQSNVETLRAIAQLDPEIRGSERDLEFLAMTGQVDRLLPLLEQRNGCAALIAMRAIQAGDLKLVASLLENGFIKATGNLSNDDSFLQLAAVYGQLDIFNLLIDKGADPERREIKHTRSARNPLVTAACRSGNLALLERCWELGAPANFISLKGYTVDLVHAALGAVKNPVETLRLVLERGASPLHTDKYCYLPIQNLECFVEDAALREQLYPILLEATANAYLDDPGALQRLREFQEMAECFCPILQKVLDHIDS